MTEQANGKDKSLPDMGQLGWIERAAELHWALQIVAAALFVDSALMVVEKRNLLDFPWGAVDWSGRIGQLVVAVVVFSVLLSVVLPLCEAAARAVVVFIHDRWLYSRARETGQRPRFCVSSGELRDHADRTQSHYVFRLWQEAQEKHRQADVENARLGRLAFRVLCFLLVNIALVTPQLQPAMAVLRTPLGDEGTELFLLAAIVVLAGLAWASWCRDPWPTRWVRYAPLYQEIRAAEEASRQQSLACSRQYR